MSKPFARLAIQSIASIAVLAPASATRATTFEDITLEQLAAASDLVVIGRVEHVDVHPTGPGGQPGIHTRAVVQVAETLRGEHRTIIEVWVHGGRLGDRVRVVPGQATFRAGEEVALFLFEAAGGLWPTGMSRGKWVLGGLQPDATMIVPTGVGALGPAGSQLTPADLATVVGRLAR
ncbi:MAG: hypothetical protein M5U28_46885 [Sandaracinaceae bacterium]|nr:hypothetical protein [Sandaracinaceae bacterium]